jgi:hypothetical protein
MRRRICTPLAISLAGCANEDLTGPGVDPARPSSASAAENSGPIILRYPGEHPGPRYYALFQRGFVPNDNGWAGIVVVRSPSCVPAGFNLLDWFDAPPTAGACTLTVAGGAWWHDVLVPPPFQTRAHGLGAVPIYFVRWSELQAAIADDVITIGELESLPSLLIGEATFFEQITHNTPWEAPIYLTSINCPTCFGGLPWSVGVVPARRCRRCTRTIPVTSHVRWSWSPQ